LWPRFTLETDSDIALIPAQFVDRSGSGMRCTGHRCAALEGVVGERVACRIYRVRPEVCRACQPGDDACTMARLRHGLAALPADEGPTCEPEE
jgi:Fe-S-cluster containining protein